MTTKHDSSLAKSRMTKWRKVGLAGSSLVALGSGAGLILFGFSWTLLILAVGGIMVSSLSALFHYIGSGAYLESTDQAPKRRVQAKLNSLKFKAAEDFQEYLEFMLEALQKKKNFSKQFEQTLKSHFSETELTFSRYQELWFEAETAIESEVERTTRLIESTLALSEEQSVNAIKEKCLQAKVNVTLLFKGSEKLLLSFQESSKPENREELFEQLDELSKRTNKYLNL